MAAHTRIDGSDRFFIHSISTHLLSWFGGFLKVGQIVKGIRRVQTAHFKGRLESVADIRTGGIPEKKAKTVGRQLNATLTGRFPQR